MDHELIPLEATLDPLTRALAAGKVHAMGLNATLASRLGRSDLAGFNPPTVQDPYSNPQNTVGVSGGLSAAASLDTGRVSAALVGLLVLGAAGFYLWTRRFQS